jgi:hypothetical protein
MITRRRFILGTGTAAALGAALRVRATAQTRAMAPTADRDGGAVLNIAQARAGSGRGVNGPVAPVNAADVPLLWRLGAHEILDARRLDERLARWPEARVHAVVDSANHLLLTDALRQRGGVILNQRWSTAEKRWTLVARAGRSTAR